MIAYLDIDDVLADFINSVGRLHGINDLVEEWDKRVEERGLKPPWYNLAEILGITDDELWRRVGLFEEAFWRTLPILPWAEELYHAVCTVADETILLTSPSYAPSCVKGKIEWIQRQEWIEDKRAWIMTPAKHKRQLANSDSVLIDDSTKNCGDFVVHGGKAILFPQPWNVANKAVIGNAKVGYIVNILTGIKETR